MDNNLLRARAFLSEPFLKDNWTILLLIFLFNAVMPLTETLGLFIEKSISELIKKTIQLGIIIGIVLLEYKWFKLMIPAEHHNPSTKQESRSTKRMDEKVFKIPEDKHSG
jgi:hypothetical protein